MVNRRIDGFLPLRDYAVIGDGRTMAAVGIDGSIDWLCLPDLDSESVFAAILDPERGGAFGLSPAIPFEAERRYVPGTTVLETTFRTNAGAVRVTDAMLLPSGDLHAERELARRIEGLAGSVPMRWTVRPRFGYALRRTRLGQRAGVPVATSGGTAVALMPWDAGEARVGDESIEGEFECNEGTRSLLLLSSASDEPLVFSPRERVEDRFDSTVEFWKQWSASRSYEGEWREEVLRSVMTLKLLVHAPSGAIAAAATTSLPETMGGERNWDYRYCWIRDSVLTLDALLSVGCPAEGEAFLWWLLHASQTSRPRVRVLYSLDGGRRTPERELPLAGYRDSQPVRTGNAAADQRQLDVYGELLRTVALYAEAGGRVEREMGRRLAHTANELCGIWREEDTGIWEVRGQRRHFTQSKMMCWVALDCASSLCEKGVIPGRHSDRWRREAEAIRDFIEEECWSDSAGSYMRDTRSDDFDASVLLAMMMGYEPADPARTRSTIDAVRRELGDGPLVYRYRGEDGLRGSEGAFVACSFWVAEMLARSGDSDGAAEQFEQTLEMANDVGLYTEEIDPATGSFLGNLPQGLVHLSLISAATAISKEGLR